MDWREYDRIYHADQRRVRRMRRVCLDCGAPERKPKPDHPPGVVWTYKRCAACLTKRAARQREYDGRKAVR